MDFIIYSVSLTRGAFYLPILLVHRINLTFSFLACRLAGLAFMFSASILLQILVGALTKIVHHMRVLQEWAMQWNNWDLP